MAFLGLALLAGLFTWSDAVPGPLAPPSEPADDVPSPRDVLTWRSRGWLAPAQRPASLPGAPVDSDQNVGLAGAAPDDAAPLANVTGPRLPATRVVQTARGPLEIVADEVLVQLRPRTTPEALQRLAQAHGLMVRESVPELDAARLAVDAPERLGGALRALRREAAVAYAGPHPVMRGAGALGVHVAAFDVTVFEDGGKYVVSPTDDKDDGQPSPLGGLQWMMKQLDWNHVVEFGVGGDDVIVAILDTGVAYEDHVDASGTYAEAPDLGHVPFVAPWDFVAGDSHANDDHGHGTQMATLIAGFGLTLPMAPNVALMPVKVLDSQKRGTELALVEGLRWATEHAADVVNMSLSFPEGYVPSPIMEAAIAHAAAAGVVMIAATGNDGARFTSYPAAFRDVVAVGASIPKKVTDGKCEGGRAAYSNSSAATDVMAPVGSHALDTNLDGLPDAALSMTFPPGQPTALGYWFVSGTSAGAAMASAAAALLVQAGAAAHHVAGYLMDSADAGGMDDDFDAEMGAGVFRTGKAVKEAIDHPLEGFCGAVPVFVNPAGGLVEPSPGYRQAVFVVEVVWEDGQPLEKERLLGRLRGATTEDVVAKIEHGVAIVESSIVPADEAAGVGWTLEVEAVQTEVHDCGKWIIRPHQLSRVDEATFALLSNLGTGLISSAVILRVDPSATAGLLELADQEGQALDTFVRRPLGTGLISSALVAISDEPYLRAHPTLSESVILRSFGTGLISSAIVVDHALFAVERLAAFADVDLVVRHVAVGTGLISSAIVRGDELLPLDAYLAQLESAPGILRTIEGDLVSEALVFDRGLFAASLQGTVLDPAEEADAVATGTGLISSARVVDLSLANLTWLGLTGGPLVDLVASGTGLISSALVGPTAWLATFGLPTTSMGGLFVPTATGLISSALIGQLSLLSIEPYEDLFSGVMTPVARAVSVGASPLSEPWDVLPE